MGQETYVVLLWFRGYTMSEKADDLNLLSGLEEFGFTDLDSISLYGEPESKRSEAVKPKEKTE